MSMEETLGLLHIACDMRHKYVEMLKNINIELNQAREQLSTNASQAEQLEKQSSNMQLYIKLLTNNVVDLAKELVAVARQQ